MAELVSVALAPAKLVSAAEQPDAERVLRPVHRELGRRRRCRRPRSPPRPGSPPRRGGSWGRSPLPPARRAPRCCRECRAPRASWSDRALAAPGCNSATAVTLPLTAWPIRARRSSIRVMRRLILPSGSVAPGRHGHAALGMQALPIRLLDRGVQRAVGTAVGVQREVERRCLPACLAPPRCPPACRAGRWRSTAIGDRTGAARPSCRWSPAQIGRHRQIVGWAFRRARPASTAPSRLAASTARLGQRDLVLDVQGAWPCRCRWSRTG